MTYRSFAFTTFRKGFGGIDAKVFKEFVGVLAEQGYNFEVKTEGIDQVHVARIVEVEDISDELAEEYEEYEEMDEDAERDEDYDSYEDSGDIEMGFNPFTGDYDFDC